MRRKSRPFLCLRPAVTSVTVRSPIWTQNRGWRDAEDLEIEDLLTHEGQAAWVVGIEENSGFSLTLNLTVEGTHTFFIVSDGVSVLVHNLLRIHAAHTG